MRQNVSQKFTEPSVKTHVGYLRVTSIRRPGNIVDIYSCNLLWLSRQLIISTEQSIIYISTFPYTLTSNHAIQIALVCERSTLLSCNFVNRYKYAECLMTDEDENFGGSLVLDFRKR